MEPRRGRFTQVKAPGEDGTGLTVESKIQVEQIRAVDVARVGRRLGRLPRALHEPLREAMALHLGLRTGR